MKRKENGRNIHITWEGPKPNMHVQPVTSIHLAFGRDLIASWDQYSTSEAISYVI